MKPICVPCARFYRPLKNGFEFLEGMPVPSNSPPGLSHAANWKPYKLWSGDLWRCPGCGHKIIVGVGASHLSEHYSPNFASHIRDVTFQVNDC